ncbi:MAG: TetR/AcrR family transcriptional regulator [Gammaproteobacteria bacterium]
MARRSEHSLEEIKEMVLNAAETIVIEEGIGALKVRKIAMDIGYTVGSVYMVFDNMADLITHLKARALDDIAEQLREVEDCGQPEQCIKKLAQAYLAFASRHFNRWSMIFEHRLAEDAVIPAWYQQKVDALFNPLETQIQRLTPAVSEEQIRRAARALWGGIHGICILSLTGKLDAVGINDVENTLILLVENFLRGWKAEPAC